jgi:acyl transferase domain-containing protein
MSLAMLAVLRRVGVVPEMVAGHSFGEVCALHAAGVISADDLLHIARRRGELMAEASSVPGAMIAVAATRAEVEAEIAAAGVSVVIANHNAPRQVVVAGPVEAIAAFEHHLDASRISGHAIGARRLPVATAFHTALVAPAAAPFGAFLATLDLQAPRLPVFAGATASIYPAGPSDAVRAIVAEQLARPVEFVSTIEAMYAAGARYFVEVGAGSVLGGLATACLAGRPHLAVSLDRRGVSGLDAFWSGLATLAASGCALDLAALWDGYARPADPRQRTKPEFAVAINGMNYGRAYPERPGGPKLPPPHKVPTVTSASHEIAAQVATPEPLVSGVPDVAMAMAVTSVTPQTMVRAPRATHEAEASIPV